MADIAFVPTDACVIKELPVNEYNANPGEIELGYAEWMQEKERAVSKKIDFGTWWRLNTTYWRVVWLEGTNELYAAERPPSDRFVLLSQLEKKEVVDLMRKWFDGDNLEALFGRFKINVASLPKA